MKRLILVICLAITAASGISHAQIAPGRQTIDTDLLALRNTVVPDFHHSYDDYLQYAPAGLMVGMKACGYDCIVIIKPECGHHPHSLEDPTPVADFISKHF